MSLAATLVDLAFPIAARTLARDVSLWGARARTGIRKVLKPSRNPFHKQTQDGLERTHSRRKTRRRYMGAKAERID